MSLRGFLTRLIWWCLLPGFVIAIWLAVTHVQDLRDESDREGQRSAWAVARAIDETLATRIDALKILASSPLADDPARWVDLYAEAQGLSRSFGGAVYGARLDGTLRLHTAVPWGAPIPPAPKPAGVSAIDRAVASGQPAVGDAFVGPLAQEVAVAVAVPGVRQGRVQFVVVNVVAAPQLSRRIDDLALPATWGVVVRDSLGTAIARVGSAARAAASPVDAGVKFMAAPEQVPWQVELTMPRDERARPMVWATVSMTLAMLGALLAGALGGRWASRRLATAVRSLVDPVADAAARPDIDEIRLARQAMSDAAQARERAQAERRDAEHRHHASLDQATIALQVREAQLRGIFDSASDAILTIDDSHLILMANAAAAQVFRTTVAELVGTALDRLIPESARGQHRDAVHAFGQTEPPARPMGHGAGVTALRTDGEVFPIEGAISQAHVDGQRLYTIILRDVTARQQAEQELRDSKAKLEAAMASMNDAVFISDLDGRFIDFNAAFATFHRFRDKSECPRSLQDYAAVVDVLRADGLPAPRSQWPVARALRGESGSLVDLRMRRKDTGESWTGSFSFAPIKADDGSVAGAVTTARDITLLKRVQADLEASHDDLRRLVAAQDRVQEAERKRIARELHDDLQQTLAAILMESTAMRGERHRSSVPALNGLVHIDRLATAAIASTRRIVNDLRPQMLEELGLVPALQALARRFATSTGIACGVDATGFAPADPDVVGNVSICLFRVTQEALTNVAKHAQARRVHIELRESSPARWRLTIHDDGTGLPEHDRHKPGSFGLLGMRERVHALGGTIRIHGDPGAGTTVEVEVGGADSVDPTPV